MRRFLLMVVGLILTLPPLFGKASSLFAGEKPVAPGFVEIASGVHVFEGAYETFTPENAGLTANMSFIVGTQSVAVVDTGGSMIAGRKLLSAIRRQTDLPVKYVINTHMHPDHAFGNAAFEGTGTLFVGHKKLARALTLRGDYYLQANKPLLGPEAFEGVRIVVPSLAVEETVELDIGERVLVLTAHPTAHTDNDLTVFDKNTATLWTGDLLFSIHVPALDGSITGWLSVMEALKAVKAERVVPGHGPVSLPWPEGAKDQERYLRSLADQVRASIKAGVPLSEAAEKTGSEERARWKLFDDFNARNVAAAYSELEWE